MTSRFGPPAAGLAFLLLAGGCGGGAPPGLVITNARIVDGSGASGFVGAVRVLDGRIAAVGPAVSPSPGDAVFDADGLTLAPGFVDTHSHADSDLLERLDATAAVSQGITTLVVGQDGGSRWPLAAFRERLEATPATVNVAGYAGHNTLRRRVLGEDFRREATEAEVASMRRLLETELAAGALGLSTGLEYDPGIYSAPEEVLELARAAAAVGGRYISHLRSEDRGFREAVEEIVRIGAETGMPVQISHAKLALRSLWGEAPWFLGRLDEARSAGVDITLDVYPYPYWQSTLTVMFPDRNFDDLEEARFVVAEIASPAGMLIRCSRPGPPTPAERSRTSRRARGRTGGHAPVADRRGGSDARRPRPRPADSRGIGPRHQHGRGRHRGHLRLGIRELGHRRRTLRGAPRAASVPFPARSGSSSASAESSAWRRRCAG